MKKITISIILLLLTVTPVFAEEIKLDRLALQTKICHIYTNPRPCSEVKEELESLPKPTPTPTPNKQQLLERRVKELENELNASKNRSSSYEGLFLMHMFGFF